MVLSSNARGHGQYRAFALAALLLAAPHPAGAAEQPSDLPQDLAEQSDEQIEKQFAQAPNAAPIGSAEADCLLAAGRSDDGASPSDTPTVSELSRHVSRLYDDFWWNGADGVPIGRIRRAKWRQLLRAKYEFTSNSGDAHCAGIQPLQNSLMAKSLTALDITDADAKTVAKLRGRLWTMAKAKFELRSSSNEVVAHAWLDDQLQSVIFTRPGDTAQRVASFNRERQADDAPDRWRLVIVDPLGLPTCAWGVIGSFFVRYYQPSGRV